MESYTPQKIDISKFLALTAVIPVIDVRSPSEYSRGHIPGAVNIPLFDDKERETVGICYKNEGRREAILKGIELTGNQMHLKLQKALYTAKESKLLVYCWRGGMRSETMAWLFALGDIDVKILERGYKAYRNYVIDSLSIKRKTIILGGMTGSSKTHILRHLRQEGEQVIDLEQIARHKGSAFGALGQAPQPTSEHFANMLYDEWRHMAPGIPIWLEDESKNIGNVFMPDTFYNNLQESPTIILYVEMKDRLPLLVEEYSQYPPDQLKNSIMKISKRLGGDKTKEAIEAVDRGDFTKAVEITLLYYDKAYLYGISRKIKENLITVKSGTNDYIINAGLVFKAAKKIKW